MKKLQLISAFAALSVLAITTPAAAFLGYGNSLKSETKLETNLNYNNDTSDRSDDDQNDDQNNDDKNNGRDEDKNVVKADVKVSGDARWSHWMWNAGIAGTVTARSGNTITVKGTNNTVYTVDASNTKIRGAGSSNDDITSIVVGDKVLVQGAVDGTNVVATLIIDAKRSDPKPTAEDKRSGIAGTVTATSNTTLTVIGKNGTTYTVDAANATIWKNKKESTTLSSITVGNAVIVQGTVSGSSVTATRIYVIDVPQAAPNGGIRGTVTAVDTNSITLLATGGTKYTVNTSSTAFKDRKGSSEDKSNITAGEMVTVQGDVSGSDINASVVSETKEGFFFRFGNFFKHLFGKKNQ